MRVRNIFIIFLISGFWHGANWTFVIWGALNALYFLPLLLSNRNRLNLDIIANGRLLPSFREAASMALTFGLTLVAWIFFRSESVSQALDYTWRMFMGLVNIETFREAFSFVVTECGFVRPFLFCLFFVIEWIGRNNEFAIGSLGFTWPRAARWTFYYVIAVMIILYPGAQQDFIYFQF